jgi:hypothetical protein
MDFQMKMVFEFEPQRGIAPSFIESESSISHIQMDPSVFWQKGIANLELLLYTLKVQTIYGWDYFHLFILP